MKLLNKLLVVFIAFVSINATQANQQILIDLSNQLLMLETQVAQLTGKLEQAENTIEQLKQNQAAQFDDMQNQIDALNAQSSQQKVQYEQEIKDLKQSQTTIVQTTVVEEKDFVKSDKEAEQAYEKAKQYVFDRDYPAAIKAFTGVAELYPNTKQSANANYWLGEMYLVLDEPDVEMAKKSFIKSVENIPAGQRKPDALLRLSQTLVWLNQPNQAQTYLNQLLQEFPNHNNAIEAQALLAELGLN